jgi:hypothetical protein
MPRSQHSIIIFTFSTGLFENLLLNYAFKPLTRIMLNFEGCPNVIVSIRVHAEGEGRSVALRPIIVVSGEDLDHFARRTVFGQDGAVVFQEPWGVVVDVLNGNKIAH